MKQKIIYITAIIITFGLIFFYQKSSYQTSQILVTISPSSTLKLPHINCSSFGFGNEANNDFLIYDFTIFNGELDMLEIRLYELNDYVDQFLIAESNLTLSGKPKPFYLKNHWDRFRRYHNKIRRVEVLLFTLNGTKRRSWDNEDQMRDEGLRLALPKSDRNFILMTSDIDEIPKARYIRALKSCQLPDPFPATLLKCDFYYYSFEFRQPSSPHWPAVSVAFYKPNEVIPSKIRHAKNSYQPAIGTCFHCSYCFDTVAAVRLKLSSFSHMEVDIDRFRNLKHILDRYKHGKDLFDNIVQPFPRPNLNETEIPQLLLVESERDRFDYMWKRLSMDNIGFRDLDNYPNATLILNN